MLGFGANFLQGRAISYLAAATFTWGVNRVWTFGTTDDAWFCEWAKFIMANAAGGILNYCVYAAVMIGLTIKSSFLPVLAVAAGSVSGLLVNFALSKRLVFASRRAGPGA